ncbi:MAG: SDR family NAD(P)-dependent oxidoreductase [Marinomonas sp.]
MPIPAKNILFTGGTGGLAKEALTLLLTQDLGKITVAGRNKDKLAQVKQELVAELGAERVSKLNFAAGFDMSNPIKIEAAINHLPSQPFDIVCLGAGGAVFGNQRQTFSWQGKEYEKTLFQNVIGGHVTLAHLLKRQLIANGARVVVIGGEGARGIKGMIAKPGFASVQALQDYVFARSSEKYNPMNALGASKLLAALWSQHLSHICQPHFESIWFTPGFIYGTGGTSGLPKWQEWFAQKIVFKIMAKFGMAQSPSLAASKLVACLNGSIGKNGDLLGAPEGKTIGPLTDQKPMNKAFTDKALQAEFWSILTTLYPIDSDYLADIKEVKYA